MKRGWGAAFLLAAGAVAAGPAGAVEGVASGPRAPCPSSHLPALELPVVRAALGRNQEVVVVALGSSSTAGWHAADVAHSYPALLQAGLNAAMPASHVAVLNRGVGGQDVSEMLPRIERDVLGARPTLVIWQVGANGAMKHVPPEVFRRLLSTGVQRLKEAHVDVVLLDNQRAPMILAAPEHERYDRVMAEVAAATGAGLFDRGALMDQWQAQGYPYGTFLSEDGVHHNDLGYRCVAEALTGAIVDGSAPSPVRSSVVDRSPR